MEEIKQQIRAYIKEEFLYDGGVEMVPDDESLIQAGIIDSLGIFLLVSFLDEKLNVKVAPEDVVVENFDNVDAIARLVLARRSTASA